MKAQGSRNDLKLHARPPLARDSAKSGHSCTRMKTTPKSGQARRGLDGAQRGMAINFTGRGRGREQAKKRPPESAVKVGMGLVKRWCLQLVRTA